MLTVKNKYARTVLRYALPLCIIPLAVLLGAVLIDEKKYMLIVLAVTLAALLLFCTGFEKKNIGTRRMVICSVMTALSIVGRFIPLFKPITAIAVISAMYLGAESGFLVGALSVLLSNFYFGQGPWTPFQMLAFGLLGYFAGLLGGALKKYRILLILYGIISGIAFSFIMDIWTVLWYNGTFNISLYRASLLSAVPYTLVYSVSNVIYLCILSDSMGQKLERIKKKYGI